MVPGHSSGPTGSDPLDKFTSEPMCATQNYLRLHEELSPEMLIS